MARVEALRDAADKKETGVFSSFAQHFSKLPNEVPNCLPAKCFFTLSLGRLWKEDQHTPRSCKIFQFFHLPKFIKNLILLEWSRKLRDNTKNGCMCSRLHFVLLKYFFGSFEKRHALRAFRRVWRARVNKNLAALGDTDCSSKNVTKLNL